MQISTGIFPCLPSLSPCSLCSVVQLCATHCKPLVCNLPGFSAHGIFQAWILEWVAISSSRRSSWFRSWTQVLCISCIGKLMLCHSATWEDPLSPYWPTKTQYCVFFFFLIRIRLCHPPVQETSISLHHSYNKIWSSHHRSLFISKN